MLLLAGLGNPGPKYAGNRHNIGFMAIDRIHERHRFPAWRKNFQSEVAEGTIAGSRVLLMKPQTFMNESGRAVGDAARFLKLAPTDVVVLHDELDLPPGKIRMKTGGGHGGHNGLRSITSQITDGYRRLRLGIGHPGVKELVHAHVLSDFAKADQDWLDALLGAVAAEIPVVVAGDDQGFMNRMAIALGGGAHPPAAPSEAPARPTPKAKSHIRAARGASDADKRKAADRNPMVAMLQKMLKRDGDGNG